MDKLTWYDEEGGFTAAVGMRSRWRGWLLTKQQS